MGGRGYGGGGRGRVYTYRYTVTTRMTCIKMGSDKSHCNVSLIVRDKVTTETVSTLKPQLLKRKESRSGRYRTEVLAAYQATALPLGQTGSRNIMVEWMKCCLVSSDVS